MRGIDSQTSSLIELFTAENPPDFILEQQLDTAITLSDDMLQNLARHSKEAYTRVKQMRVLAAQHSGGSMVHRKGGLSTSVLSREGENVPTLDRRTIQNIENSKLRKQRWHNA